MDVVGQPVKARTIAWLRLVLVLMAGAASLLFLVNRHEHTANISDWLLILGAVVLAAALGLLVFSASVKRPWQLALQLVFDLCWIGVLLWLTGGVDSPAVSLLFAILLIGTQALPGVAPFMLPAVASLVLALITALYLAGLHMFSESLLASEPLRMQPKGMLGALAVQLAALFLVDLLGQALASRVREARLFTAELLDQLGEGVLAIDRAHHIVYANAGLGRLLPVLGEPLPGRPARAMLADPVLADLCRWLVDEHWPRVERLNINGMQLVARIDLLHDRRGRPIGRVMVVSDETRLRVLEDNVRRNERLTELGEMAAGIAHEVRNPLTSLRGCAQELADIATRSHNPDAAHLAGIMISEADRLARIVDDVLSLTRVRDPVVQGIDVAATISEIITLVRSRRDLPPGLVLSERCAHVPHRLLADPDQFRQVLLNLLNNAIDACRNTPNGQIEVAVEPTIATAPIHAGGRPTALLRLSVSDNGSGISESLQERVFAPFFSTKAKGSGLGLSLVARIVRNHGGTIDVLSQPGQGTTMRIDWPAQPVPVAQA